MSYFKKFYEYDNPYIQISRMIVVNMIIENSMNKDAINENMRTNWLK